MLGWEPRQIMSGRSGSANAACLSFFPDSRADYGKHVYVANGGSANVSVIDTATNTVLATVPVGTNPRSIAVTPDGKRAYVTS